MTVRIGCGLSTGPDPRVAAIEAGQQAHAGLEGARADIACVFATGTHLAAPEATLEGVQEALAPPVLVGCGAGGVVGDGREIERGTAVAVWAASLGGGRAEAFHLDVVRGPDALAVGGLPDLDDATAVVLLPDPYSFPTDVVLGELARRAPGVPVLGGIASARTLDGNPALFLGDALCGDGAVGVAFSGVEVLPCVSQGAAPVGPELTVTAADGHVIVELAGRPALDALREAIEALQPDEQALVASGLLLGVVIDGGKPEYEQGDFLVRGVIGADPDAGTLTVGAPVQPGTVVRLHARDAVSADRDLRTALGLRREALGGGAPAGALVFTCNGRGEAMFGMPDHDATALEEELAGAPAAGFFAAGEIGPVGGDPFLHGFTATVAVFPAVNVAGRTVLLTGATGGLGQAIARRLHTGGAQLVLTGRRVDVLDGLAAETGALTVAVDLADPVAVDGLAEACADVDVLVANAGVPASGQLTSFSVEEIDRALAVNLRAPMVLARHLAERMVARRSGHIVFMSSLAGKVGPARGSVYSATKFGLRGFAQSLREDLRPSGVGVSAIFPGFVRDAGLFHDAGVKVPAWVGTVAPDEVADAVLRAIEENRGEVDVAPLGMRAGTKVAGLAPDLAASVQRRLGAQRIAEQHVTGQVDKR